MDQAVLDLPLKREPTTRLPSVIGSALVVVGCLVSALQVFLAQPLFVLYRAPELTFEWMFLLSYGAVVSGLVLLLAGYAPSRSTRVSMVLSIVLCAVCAVVTAALISIAIEYQGDLPEKFWFFHSMFPIAVGPSLISTISCSLLTKKARSSARDRLLGVVVPATAVIGLNFGLVLLWRALDPTAIP